MIFLNPAYLWALLGLAVPVAIHLWSRKEGRTIKVGSIRLLSASDPKQSSSLYLNELWLLFLRLLAVTVLVLILAEPYLKEKPDPVPVTYLIEASLFSNEEISYMLDTIQNGSSIRFLQPGFPKYNKDKVIQDPVVPNYWQLAKEMEELETDSLVVFTNAFARGFKGKRPQMNRNINWIVLDPGDVVEEPVMARKIGKELEMISVVSDPRILRFEKERIAASGSGITITEKGDSVTVSSEGRILKLPLRTEDSLQILLVHNNEHLNELQYITAAYKAISSYMNIPIIVKQEEYENISEDSEAYETVVWLSEKEPITTTAPLLIFRQDSLAGTLIEKGNSNEYFLTQPLDSENIIEEHLAEKLLALLDPVGIPQENLGIYDRRLLSPEEFEPLYTAGISEKRSAEGTGLSKYLWVLLLLLLLAERGLSYYRKQ